MAFSKTADWTFMPRIRLPESSSLLQVRPFSRILRRMKSSQGDCPYQASLQGIRALRPGSVGFWWLSSCYFLSFIAVICRTTSYSVERDCWQNRTLLVLLEVHAMLHAATFASRRLWALSFVKFAPRYAFTYLRTFGPITREPRTITCHVIVLNALSVLIYRIIAKTAARMPFDLVCGTHLTPTAAPQIRMPRSPSLFSSQRFQRDCKSGCPMDSSLNAPTSSTVVSSDRSKVQHPPLFSFETRHVPTNQIFISTHFPL